MGPPEVIDDVFNRLTPCLGEVIAQGDIQFCDQLGKGNLLSCVEFDHGLGLPAGRTTCRLALSLAEQDGASGAGTVAEDEAAVLGAHVGDIEDCLEVEVVALGHVLDSADGVDLGTQFGHRGLGDLGTGHVGTPRSRKG